MQTYFHNYMNDYPCIHIHTKYKSFTLTYSLNYSHTEKYTYTFYNRSLSLCTCIHTYIATHLHTYIHAHILLHKHLTYTRSRTPHLLSHVLASLGTYSLLT